MAEDNPFDHLIQTDELDEVERLEYQEVKSFGPTSIRQSNMSRRVDGQS